MKHWLKCLWFRIKAEKKYRSRKKRALVAALALGPEARRKMLRGLAVEIRKLRDTAP